MSSANAIVARKTDRARWAYRDQIERFCDALTLFGIGYSWGGVAGLVMSYRDLDRPTPKTGPLLVRFNIGLEEPADLIADIDQALAIAQSSR